MHGGEGGGKRWGEEGGVVSTVQLEVVWSFENISLLLKLRRVGLDHFCCDISTMSMSCSLLVLTSKLNQDKLLAANSSNTIQESTDLTSTPGISF